MEVKQGSRPAGRKAGGKVETRMDVRRCMRAECQSQETSYLPMSRAWRKKVPRLRPQYWDDGVILRCKSRPAKSFLNVPYLAVHGGMSEGLGEGVTGYSFMAGVWGRDGGGDGVVGSTWHPLSPAQPWLAPCKACYFPLSGRTSIISGLVLILFQSHCLTTTAIMLPDCFSCFQ
ncbi:hypothetical protein E2C01_009402 [Portunus trituberculatus]|uniref:Uncharacterized protein n=1 Tax=Portunus trituberculatus TaxID=210409 RepID=A0A5B7D3F8_PORTR|nr:hypothetical protein [Portunus trituberculatus]